MKKIEYLIKHNRFIQFIYKKFFSALFKFLTLFVPVNDRLILINSFSGKKYNDSPKILYEKIVERFGSDKFKIVWAFENPKNFKEFNLNTVKINSYRYFHTAFRAKYWISNVNIERGLSFKKKKQIYLNTWHGTGPKSIGNGANNRKDYNFSKTNYLCADGDFLKNVLLKYFNAREDSILMCGRPREDILYNHSEKYVEDIAKRFNIKKNDLVILYAPTWREQNSKTFKSSISVDLDLDLIFEKFPNAKILFRKHSITAEVIFNHNVCDKIIDVSSVPDIADLLLITDILITDYSSIPTDFSILGKPFLCFAPDYEEYTSTRKLFYDITTEYPFGIQKSTEEIVECINEILCGNNKKDEFQAFKDKYCPYGGHATDICIDKLFGESTDIERE